MAYLVRARSPSLLGAYRRVSAVPVLPQQRVQPAPQPRGEHGAAAFSLRTRAGCDGHINFPG